jgi:hypothetical protein
MLNMVDEYTHECLAIRIARRFRAVDVIELLSDLFILRGVPAHIRSDNGPELIAGAVRGWIAAIGAKTAYIAPDSPWECRMSTRAKHPTCGVESAAHASRSRKSNASGLEHGSRRSGDPLSCLR